MPSLPLSIQAILCSGLSVTHIIGRRTNVGLWQRNVEIDSFACQKYKVGSIPLAVCLEVVSLRKGGKDFIVALEVFTHFAKILIPLQF